MRRSRNLNPFWLELLGLGLGVGLLAGCPDRNVSEVNPNQDKEEVKDIPVQLNRDLDLLFVVDNSGSMAEEQASLAANFPIFVNVLQTIEGGLPNIHLGVVSSDVGAGPDPITNCSGSGDNGRLQTAPQINGAYLEDVSAGAAGSGNCPSNADRNCNYTGTLAQAFTDAATLGIDGCGFEQHLESMRRALNGSNSFNAGFLRPSAYLGVVFLQDEDDCSTENTAMFDTSQNSVSDPLGPLASFRCTEFGVDCETGNSDPRAPGPRTNCFPRDPSPYMYGVQEYVDFLKGLKDDDSLIVVAGIMGNPEPFAVGVDPERPQNPALVPSCESSSGKADPAVRVKYLLDQFPDRNAFTTICNENLADGIQLIAELLKEAIGNPCIQATLKPTVPGCDPLSGTCEYECTVSDVVHPGEDNQTETLLPECNAVEPTPLDTTDTAASTNVPCWHLETDNGNCGETATHLSLVVERNGASAPTGTHVMAHCLTCVDSYNNDTPSDLTPDGKCDPTL